MTNQNSDTRLNWPHDQKVKWFRDVFRPHFEKWVVSPLQDMIDAPSGGMPAFVWLSCAIEWLAGFWYGDPTDNKTAKVYKSFLNEYFDSNRYDVDDLYDSLRNGLVHMYIINNTFANLENGVEFARKHQNRREKLVYKGS